MWEIHASGGKLRNRPVHYCSPAIHKREASVRFLAGSRLRSFLSVLLTDAETAWTRLHKEVRGLRSVVSREVLSEAGLNQVDIQTEVHGREEYSLYGNKKTSL
jgi:hypothetical protein